MGGWKGARDFATPTAIHFAHVGQCRIAKSQASASVSQMYSFNVFISNGRNESFIVSSCEASFDAVVSIMFITWARLMGNEVCNLAVVFFPVVSYSLTTTASSSSAFLRVETTMLFLSTDTYDRRRSVGASSPKNVIVGLDHCLPH